MFDIYRLEPITHEFLDAIDACTDSLELRKLALRIIIETPPNELTASIDPEKVGDSTDVVALKKLIGELLAWREFERLNTIFNNDVENIPAVSYTPSNNFLLWLQQHRPATVGIVKAAKNLTLEKGGVRYKLRFPGLLNTPNGLMGFDRQIDTEELCMVLDAHPDELI
jgi:hypothetical protein